MEALQQGTASHHAEMVIVDIMGVQTVDAQASNTFICTSQAVHLLGAQVMITGIQSQIAQVRVHGGIDLRAILTHSTLQEGIAAALQRRHKREPQPIA